MATAIEWQISQVGVLHLEGEEEDRLLPLLPEEFLGKLR